MFKPLLRSACLALTAVAAIVAGLAQAQPASEQDACFALMEARRNLVDMLITTDKATLDDLKGKVHAASTRLDNLLMGMEMSMDAAAAQKAADFKAVWEEFKNTRETAIIPALHGGRPDEAKALANGIQAERVKKMKATMGCQ